MIRVFVAAAALLCTTLVAWAEQKAFVTFTFDDAPKSVLTVGLPILKKYDIPCTIYISTRNTTRPGYMNWDDIDAAASEYNCEIGAHTHTHAKLTLLTNEQIEEEFRISTEEFAKHGYVPEHFATPFGHYDDRVLALIAEHYASHRTAWPIGMNTLSPDPYRIVSYYLTENTTMEEIRGLLSDLQNRGGWVVFQLHFVTPKGDAVTDPYGTNLLEDIVELVRKEGFTTLTIGETLKQL